MAFTVVRTPMVMGNKRAYNLEITADAATQTVETGLSVIEGFAVGVKSCSTGPQYIYANSNASGVQSMGVLGISGLTSGDTMYVLVYGR